MLLILLKMPLFYRQWGQRELDMLKTEALEGFYQRCEEKRYHENIYFHLILLYLYTLYSVLHGFYKIIPYVGF